MCEKTGSDFFSREPSRSAEARAGADALFLLVQRNLESEKPSLPAAIRISAACALPPRSGTRLNTQFAASQSAEQSGAARAALPDFHAELSRKSLNQPE
jgi:hypothetical protein